MDEAVAPQMPVQAPLRYHTAYGHGFVNKPDGSFDHYHRVLDDTHTQLGHWRFVSNQDDQLAHARGFRTPEQLLAEQARSNEHFDEIQLRWIPGTNDPTLKAALQGTVTEHLRNIYETRKLLGMPMSLQGDIPLLPVSQDIRLRQYWEKHLAKLHSLRNQTPAAEVLQSSSSFQTAASSELQVRASYEVSAQPSSLPLPGSSLDRSELHQYETGVQMLESASKEKNNGQMTQGDRYELDTARSASMGQNLHYPLRGKGPAPQQREATPAVPPSPDLTQEPVLPTSDHVTIAEPYSPENQGHQFEMPIRRQTDSLEDNAAPQSPRKIEAEERKDSCYENPDVYSELPCMDCGEVEGHLFDCNLGKLEASMTGELNILELRDLAEQVERNDPGPWTTHWDPNPSPPPEDPDEVIRGMADVIRNEDSYRNDPSLHQLPDEFMIMLWAFKTSPNVTVLDQSTEAVEDA